MPSVLRQSLDRIHDYPLIMQLFKSLHKSVMLQQALSSAVDNQAVIWRLLALLLLCLIIISVYLWILPWAEVFASSISCKAAQVQGLNTR